MKRLSILVPLLTVGLLTSGLTTEGWATARIAHGTGDHHAPVHVINLHKAYAARLGHATVGQPAGTVYAVGQAPAHGRGGNDCSEPYCPVYYQGGLVQQSPHVYLLLWGPNWSSDPNQKATANYLENFYSGLGVESGSVPDTWSTITSQYGDTAGFPTFSGSVYQGVWQDTTTPPSGATSDELAAEADTFTSSQGITDLNDAQIVVATQSGTCPLGFAASSCPSQYRGDDCSYHDSSNEPFTNLPYLLDAGTACGEDFVNSNGMYDGFSMVGGHEYAESITDPFPFTGWWDPNDESGGEIADKCAWSSQSTDVSLSTGTFAMQPLWSNQGDECVMSRQRTGDITLDNPGNQQNYQWIKQVSLQVIGTSSYGYELSWSASGLPAGMTINTATGLISGQVQGAPGIYNVTLSASDPTVTSPVTVNFTWTVIADAGSLVTNKGSGVCLNDSNWVTTPGNEIFLWSCKSSSGAEKFSHPTNSDELIVFGQCMTDPLASQGAGQLQKIDPCAGTTDQEWDYNSKDEYVLKANNLCLTDPANATQDGTPAVVEKCTDAKDQQWTGS